jgi:peptidoglycan/xylan/chitin deacetylase (PgdA/CDA1 family)
MAWSARRSLTRVAWRVSAFVGALWLWRLWHRNSIIILTVHGVMDAASAGDTWNPLRHRLSPARLDEAVAALSARYRFVTFEAAVDMLAGRRRVQPYSIALTFDDGYRNQISHALPILQARGIPAIVFVSTAHAELQRPFWFDRLDYALQHARVDGCDVTIGCQSIRIRSSSREQLARSYSTIRETSKAVVRDDRDMARELDALASTLEVESGCALADVFADDPWTALLTVGQISAAAGEMSFGSHTADHVRLHHVDADVAREQLLSSKRSLEAWTGRPCRYLCYPDGAWNATAAAAVAAAGYEAAVTTDPGLNRVGGDLMSLRRFDLSGARQGAELLAEMSGFAEWARDTARRFRRLLGAHRADAAGSHSHAPAS